MSVNMMPREVLPRLLFLSMLGMTHSCLQDPAAAYRFTGTVCRLTYPAAVVCEFILLRNLGQAIKAAQTMSHNICNFLNLRLRLHCVALS